MDLIGQLSQQGILGLLLALSIIAIIFQYRENRALYKSKAAEIEVLLEKRRQDAVDWRDTFIQPQKEIRETLDKLLILTESGSKRRP